MKKIVHLLAVATLCISSCSTNSSFNKVTIEKDYSHKVDSVLNLMTLDEKIGQLNQYTSDDQLTGPGAKDEEKVKQIIKGKVGSMLNVTGVKDTRKMQEYAMQSRLRIPLLFGYDVIHGFNTVYPIPLGEAASFNTDLMRRTAAGAAKEASACGIHWTFAPMVDIARDARWGRVMEGAGEDTWYGCKVSNARVKGFQGDNLADVNTVLACAKHFAAYGACIAGKDYNTTDMSLMTLHEVYLPPFKAAVDAGVATFMNSFNDLNGIPATGNQYLQRKMLKGEWGFNGFTVSDWGSIGEMINHGYAADKKQAASEAILAGSDMDMESRCYITSLKELVESKAISEDYIDDAVRRILLKKFQLGLFDDPYRYCNEEREKSTVLSQELKDLSREAGKKSVVLLKNTDNTLPIIDNPSRIALIGALADSKIDMRGFWAGAGDVDGIITVKEGLEKRFNKSKIVYSQGYDLETNELKLQEAVQNAKNSDIVIVAVGERWDQSGEAKSKADINIPASQQLLVKELKATGKKVIVLLMAGRPVIFNEMAPYADSILLTWWLGTEAGNAIADVISGDYNPSGKLPITFPAHIGQLPIYYNYKSTGRPESKQRGYTCCYQDIDYEPAYAFGYGLSYTTFEIGEPVLSKKVYKMDEPVTVDVVVKNTGKYAGTETVQLYIRDIVGTATRPVKELRGYEQVYLQPNQEKKVTFKLDKKDLGFYDTDINFVTEAGEFAVMSGNSSNNLKSATFTLEN